MFDSHPARGGPLPVWPYHFSAAVAALAGLAMIWIWSPEDFPAKADLAMVSGDIARVRVRDDITGGAAGAIMPAVTSVYFTFKGAEREYRYPSTQPDYFLVRDYTAVNLDVWVDGAKIGGAAPLRIWQIRENNPNNLLTDPTFVTYEAIIDRLISIDRSMVIAGRWLLLLCASLILIGRGVQAGNHRRFQEWR